MTTIGLKRFQSALENRQLELRSGNRNREALALDTSADVLDRIQHASDRDYAMSNLERNSSQSREVQTALGRITAGTFGICDGCGESIHPKRLAAVPWASCCIACQEAVDRGQEAPRSGIDARLDTPLEMAA
jgi:DnaK suppressor protein